MGKLVTSNFNSHNAKQFVESITESANSIYYVFIGKHTEFEGGTTPTQNNSPEGTFYEPYRDMIYGKHVTDSDIKHMIANNAWTSGTVYAQYDHRDGDLKNKQFFAHVEEANGDFSVFKCLGNNKGAPSTEQPSASQTSPDDEIYITTADKYQWKLMYEVPLATYNKFSTAKKFPIVDHANVSGNAVSGAIDFVTVNDGGVRYNSVANGVIKATNIGGEPRMIEIESLVSANLTITSNSTVSGTFASAEPIELAGKFANGDLLDSNNQPSTTSRAGYDASARPFTNVVATAVVVESNTTHLRTVDISGNFFINKSNVIVRGSTSNATAIISDRVSDTSSVSSNNQFYKGSTFYIASGPGAGAASQIEDYIVTGSARRVLLANSTGFSNSSGMIIDSTSRFEISPTVTITGDGAGAEARAIVNTAIGAVDTIEVTKRGSGYTHANATVVGNTGIVVIESDGLANTRADTANVTVIIGPKGGHGSDPINELYSDTVGISVDFANSQGGQIPATNDFRQIGILKDPLFSNVVITLANTISSGGGTATGTSFQDEEVVTQNTSGAFGVVTSRGAGTINLSNVYGQFVTTTDANTTHNIKGGTSLTISTVSDFQTNERGSSSFSQFDQRLRLTGLQVSTSEADFQVDEVVNQPETGATGIVHTINTTATANVLSLTNVKGNWGTRDTGETDGNEFDGADSKASGHVTGKAGPDIVPHTGEVIYIENINAITRDDDQTERIKLMIEF